MYPIKIWKNTLHEERKEFCHFLIKPPEAVLTSFGIAALTIRKIIQKNITFNMSQRI